MGEFQIRPVAGSINGPDGSRDVSPTVMDLLLCLAQAQGQVISRQDLIDTLWKGSHSGESALTRCIGELRNHLDDHGDKPRFVQTVPTRGYRLVAAVSPVDPSKGSLPSDATSPASQATNSNLLTFFHELRRRRVIRVALVYLVAAWAIIQVAEAIVPALFLPAWAITLVVVLVVLGFPVALILAWAYQVESEGADPTATSVQYVLDKNRSIDFVVIAALAGVVVILTYELYLRDAAPTAQVPVEHPAAINEVGASVKKDRPSIAVLPFLNLSDDPQNEYFTDGLAEEILNLLVRMREIDVASRTSSFYFKGKDVDIKTVADALGVGNVIEGSVRRQGQTIRVTAQLIEAESGFHLWSHTYERQMEDVFQIQDDIARQVVSALEVALSGDSDTLLSRVPTDSVVAYEYFLQGRDYLRGERSESRLASARELFDRAIGIDGNFAEAYAGLCDTYLAYYDRNRSTEDFEMAERACHRGLTLDSGAGDVNTALGKLYVFSGQYDKAETEFERAIALNQRNVDAYSGLADTYKIQNRIVDAEITYQQAIDIQPGFWRGHLEMGLFLFSIGRLEEAIASFAYVVTVTPDNATGYLNLGSANFLLGEFENAVEAWERSIELEPSTSAYLNVGSSYFFLRRFDDAADMYLKASAMAPEDYEVWGALGDAYRYTDNNKVLAEKAYKKAIDLGEKILVINPNDAATIAPVAQYYANIGDEDRAVLLIAKAVALQPDDMYVQYFSGTTNASLGKNDAAVLAIEQAVALGYPTKLLVVDAGLSTVIKDDRLESLLKATDR